MSETKETDHKTAGGRKTMSLNVKRTVEQGHIRQNFSHGRSKSVLVETKRKRPVSPGAPPEEPQPQKPAPQKPEHRAFQKPAPEQAAGTNALKKCFASFRRARWMRVPARSSRPASGKM